MGEVDWEMERVDLGEKDADSVEHTVKLGEGEMEREGYTGPTHLKPFQTVPSLHITLAVSLVHPPAKVEDGHHPEVLPPPVVTPCPPPQPTLPPKALATVRISPPFPAAAAAATEKYVNTEPCMQVAGRVPTQARRWGFQVVSRVHKDTPLGNPGRNEGEGKEVGEAMGVMLLDVLTVDVVERVGENRAVGEGGKDRV